MSRIASAPVSIPSGVELNLEGQNISVKGPNGNLQFAAHKLIRMEQEDGKVRVYSRQDSKEAVALAGTTRALVNNMVHGVASGFEKRLEIAGVGYRGQAQGQKLNLTLGFSHPVVYCVPEGVTVETPTQTQIVVKGADKQQVGQVASEIRAFRPPEPYKGKGIKYADEHIIRKQAKKK
ncbi:MAG: 50S ribosomal protein L6 [Gammaproteobacteria bacterium]|nr:50S ribosomal protein L6 [Gammaproteobacteria bacterium]